MAKWWIWIDGDKREFWALSGDDCYIAARSESKLAVIGHQRAE